MLYQLIAYYTIDKGIEKSLWDYLSLTVIIFQNAAVLEVRVHIIYLSINHAHLSLRLTLDVTPAE